MRPFGSIAIVALLAVATAGCGSARPTSPKTAAGVRAQMRRFYRDERTGNAADACATATNLDQEHLMREEKVSSCPAAEFKIWNTNAGISSEAKEIAIHAKSLRTLEAEVAKTKIIVVGERATVIDPVREETEEYVYSDGRWLFASVKPNTEAAEDFKKQAEESAAKNKAIIEASEARGTANEIGEAAESG